MLNEYDALIQTYMQHDIESLEIVRKTWASWEFEDKDNFVYAVNDSTKITDYQKYTLLRWLLRSTF